MQKTVTFPAYPVYFRTPMIEGNELVIQIDNPTGMSFHGAIHVQVYGGLTLSTLTPEDTQPREIRIEYGETQAAVRFRIVEREGNAYTLSQNR